MAEPKVSIGVSAHADFSDIDRAGSQAASRLQRQFRDLGNDRQGLLNRMLGGSTARTPNDTHRIVDNVRQALERTGQTAKRLRDIRLPDQFKDAARHILDMQRGIDRLSHTLEGRDLRRRVRMSGQDVQQPWAWDWSRLGYGSAAAQHAAQQRFFQASLGGSVPGVGGGGMRGMLGGVARSWGLQQIGGAVGGLGGASGIGGIVPMGGAGSALGALGVGAGVALAVGAVAAAVKVALAGLNESQKKAESVDSIYKTLVGGSGFAELETRAVDLGGKLQLVSSEAARLAASFVRTSGAADLAAVDRAQAAGQFGRGYGIDPNASAQLFGRAELLGYGGSKQTQRDFAVLLAQTIAGSGMFGRGEAIMADMVGQISKIADTQYRTASEETLGRYGDLLAGAYAGNPALRGGGAARLLDMFNGAGSGGGLSSEALSWGAFGDAVGNDLANMKIFQEASITDRPRDVGIRSASNKTKGELLYEFVKRQSGGMPGDELRKQFAYALMEMSGGKTSMNAGMGIFDIYSDMESAPGGMAGFGSWMKKVLPGQKFDNLNPAGLQNISRVYRQLRTPTLEGSADLAKMAQGYLADKNVSAGDKDRLRAALAAPNRDQALTGALPDIAARYGYEKTPADETRQTQADLTTALGELGNYVRDLTNTIRGLTVSLARIFGLGPDSGGGALSGLSGSVWSLPIPGLGAASLARRLGGSLFGAGGAMPEVPGGPGATFNPGAGLGGGGGLPSIGARLADAIFGRGASASAVPVPGKAWGGSAPRSWRNNNPGNLVGQNFGATGTDGRFARYATPAAGWAAMEQQLKRYASGATTGTPLRSVRQILSTWAPSGENDTGAYVSAVAKALGVDPDAPLDMENRPQLEALMGAIATHEAGRPTPYGSSMQAGAGNIRFMNAGATRNKPITADLMGRVSEAIEAVYGKGAIAELYSGGQDARGHGSRRMGSTRHDGGMAGDFHVRDASGNLISGDRLGALAQYWLAKRYGGVGLEMRGGGIHLDQHSDRFPYWNYSNAGGQYTEGQRRAIKAGRAGILPDLQNIDQSPMPPALNRALSGDSPERLNARWQGQVAMDVTFRDSRGNAVQRRQALAVSEPRLAGSGGSGADSSRFSWNDTVTMPAFG